VLLARIVSRIVTDCSTILDCYSLEEILELNDMTPEDCLIYLLDEKMISLPEVKPLEYDD